MVNVGVYIRVSTAEQAEEGYSIGAQKERLTSYCKARDWLIYDYYVDGGFSGSNIDRPAMQKLISDVKAKKIDTVLVYKLDRLSRSQKDTLLLIEDVFNKHDVSFVSLNENFDTSTAFGRAMVGVLSVFAQLEREQIKERSIMGRIERAKDGYFHGGGFSPIGYDYIDGELIVNDYEAMQVRELFDLIIAGNSLHSVRKTLESKYTNKHGSWKSYSSIVSTITTPLYKGIIRYLGEEYEGRHEPIVSPEIYDKARARYEEIRWNKDGSGTVKNPFNAKYLLIGMTFCGNCGARYYVKGNYSGHGDKKKYHPYYTCYSRGKSNKTMIKDPTCKNKSYYFKDLDNIIINEIKKLSFDTSLIKQIQADSEPKQPNNNNHIIKDRIKDIDKQINRLLGLYQLDNIPLDTLSERIKALNNEKDNLKLQFVDEEIEEKQRLSIPDTKALLKRANKILDSNDTKKKRELVHSLIDEIILDGEDIIIHWAFE